MGTRFVMTEECLAHPKFKEYFVRANARDAMSTAQFDPRLPVVSVRVIRNHGTQEFTKLQLELVKKVAEGTISRQDAQAELERFWVGSLRKAVVEGDVDYGSVMAGQSVGLMDKVSSVNEVIHEILRDGEAELQKMKNFFC